MRRIDRPIILIGLMGVGKSTVGKRLAARLHLAFVDADHEIAPTWTKAAVASLAEDVDGAAGALCVPPPEGTWVQQMYGALRGRTRGRSEVTWLGAGNLAVRRTAFMQVGGFDATLESCEDVDLCHRLRQSPSVRRIDACARTAQS